ncbi:MAG: copper amine oxidase N-terminal domain-containing protein [Clostridia bacterium]|nr:copper amine oxidase N-terminal domain-containing protein [Clostridia bacterium]
MKRFLMPFFAFFLLWFTCGNAAAEEPITVTVNGSRLLFDTAPVIESDRTLVPLRVIFESLGANVRWEDATQTAVAVKGDTEIRISIDNPKMLKNGEIVILDVPARLIANRTLVPVRAVSESLNAQVDWLENSRRVVITADDSGIVYPYTVLRPSDQALLADRIPELIQGYISDGLPALFEDLPAKETISSGAESVAKLPAKLWDNAVSQMILELQLASKSSYSFDDALHLTDEEVRTAYHSIGVKYGYGADRILETFYRTNDIGTYDLWIHFLTGGTPYVTVSDRDGILFIK